MKICIAQIRSTAGNIQVNIKNHLSLIKIALEFNSDMIFFPELSITNYEPKLAKMLAKSIDYSEFESFQELSNRHRIVIGIGVPLKTSKGVTISCLVFQPNESRISYSKLLLHNDEKPFFIKGNKHLILDFKEKKIGMGICYETLYEEHFRQTKSMGADIFIASVAKPKTGIEKAKRSYQYLAAKYNTPILMSNSIGLSDDFMSCGESAIWNAKGKRVERLDSESQGLLIYNTENEEVLKVELLIKKAQKYDIESLFQIYRNAKMDLDKNGIFQWTDNYPTIKIIEADVLKEHTYILKTGDEILGAINISDEQEQEYETISWKFNDKKILVIHRLVVHPKYQKKGYATQLMNFAECFAKTNQYTSIRLDVYSQNSEVVSFYEKRNYIRRGKICFPERECAFFGMEKAVQ